MEDKGFIGQVFDLSFKEFITTKIIKVVFILIIVAAAIGSFSIIVSGFAQGFGTGILSLILAPLGFFVAVIFYRIGLELIMLQFRIADNTTKIVEAMQKSNGETTENN